jgi:hypothetical protein
MVLVGAAAVAADRARRPDQAGQVAAVPARPERADGELPGRRGHIQINGLTRQNAGLPGEARDLIGGALVADPPVPVAGAAVLGDRGRAQAGDGRPAQGRGRAGRVAGQAGDGGRGAGRGRDGGGAAEEGAPGARS